MFCQKNCFLFVFSFWAKCHAMTHTFKVYKWPGSDAPKKKNTKTTRKTKTAHCIRSMVNKQTNKQTNNFCVLLRDIKASYDVSLDKYSWHATFTYKCCLYCHCCCCFYSSFFLFVFCFSFSSVCYYRFLCCYSSLLLHLFLSLFTITFY